MQKLLRYGFLGALLIGLPGCFVHTKETVVEKPVTTTAATCTASAWVEGHYDNSGRWVSGYWKCTRVPK
jgi:hypothetical protein